MAYYSLLSNTLSEFDTFSFANTQEEIATYPANYATQVFFRTYNKLDLIDSDYKILQFDIAKSLLLVYFAKAFGMTLFGMSQYRWFFNRSDVNLWFQLTFLGLGIGIIIVVFELLMLLRNQWSWSYAFYFGPE